MTLLQQRWPCNHRALPLILVFSPLSVLKLLLIDALVGLASVVAVEHFGSDFDLGVLWDELLWDLYAVDDLYSSCNNSVVLHVGHRDEVVNFGDPKEVEWIGHEGLKSSILDACNLFGAIEVGLGRVSPLLPLASIIHQVFSHFPEGAALLAEINHKACPTSLGCLDGFLDSMRQVGTTGTNVRPEHIRAITLIVYSARELYILIGDSVRVAPYIDCQAADWGKKDLDVRTGDQFGIHAVCHAEYALAEVRLGAAEAAADFGQVPHRLDGTLGND